jgi:hypothetical protein
MSTDVMLIQLVNKARSVGKLFTPVESTMILVVTAIAANLIVTLGRIY